MRGCENRLIDFENLLTSPFWGSSFWNWAVILGGVLCVGGIAFVRVWLSLL
jgi:hypothetical protein